MLLVFIVKSINIITAFEKILYESVRKAIKIWVDKGSKFYNRSIKSCLQGNDIGMCIQDIMKGNLLLLKDLLEP